MYWNKNKTNTCIVTLRGLQSKFFSIFVSVRPQSLSVLRLYEVDNYKQGSGLSISSLRHLQFFTLINSQLLLNSGHCCSYWTIVHLNVNDKLVWVHVLNWMWCEFSPHIIWGNSLALTVAINLHTNCVCGVFLYCFVW